MSTLALIQTVIAAQGPASTAGAAIQAAIAADAALFADLNTNGPAVVVDTTQTPPAVMLYAAANIPNLYATEAGVSVSQLTADGLAGGTISSYTATPIRTAT